MCKKKHFYTCKHSKNNQLVTVTYSFLKVYLNAALEIMLATFILHQNKKRCALYCFPASARSTYGWQRNRSDGQMVRQNTSLYQHVHDDQWHSIRGKLLPFVPFCKGHI